MEDSDIFCEVPEEVVKQDQEEAKDLARQKGLEDYKKYVKHEQYWFLHPIEFAWKYLVVLPIAALVAVVDAFLYRRYNKRYELDKFTFFLFVLIVLKILITIYIYDNPMYCR